MIEQGPDGRGVNEDNNELTPEQIRASLQGLEDVLAEDTPQKKEKPEPPIGEEGTRALYEELKSGLGSDAGIEILSPEEGVEEKGTEEIFTEDFAKAQKALEGMLSEDEPTGNNNKPPY